MHTNTLIPSVGRGLDSTTTSTSGNGKIAERILLLDQATNQTVAAIDRVAGLTDRLGKIADSVFGSVLEPGSAESPAPAPSGRGEGLTTALNSLHDVLTRLELQANRFLRPLTPPLARWLPPHRAPLNSPPMPSTDLPRCHGCGQPRTDEPPLGCYLPHGGLADVPPQLLWHPDDLPEPRPATPEGS